jgi:hypothetical protein
VLKQAVAEIVHVTCLMLVGTFYTSMTAALPQLSLLQYG